MRHLVQYKSIIFYGVAIILFDRKTIIFSVFLLCYVQIFFTYNYVFQKEIDIKHLYYHSTNRNKNQKRILRNVRTTCYTQL